MPFSADESDPIAPQVEKNCRSAWSSSEQGTLAMTFAIVTGELIVTKVDEELHCEHCAAADTKPVKYLVLQEYERTVRIHCAT